MRMRRRFYFAPLLVSLGCGSTVLPSSPVPERGDAPTVPGASMDTPEQPKPSQGEPRAAADEQCAHARGGAASTRGVAQSLGIAHTVTRYFSLGGTRRGLDDVFALSVAEGGLTEKALAIYAAALTDACVLPV